MHVPAVKMTVGRKSRRNWCVATGCASREGQGIRFPAETDRRARWTSVVKKVDR